MGGGGGGWTTCLQVVILRQGLTVAHISLKPTILLPLLLRAGTRYGYMLSCLASLRRPVGKPLSPCLALYSVHKALPLLKLVGGGQEKLEAEELGIARLGVSGIYQTWGLISLDPSPPPPTRTVWPPGLLQEGSSPNSSFNAPFV